MQHGVHSFSLSCFPSHPPPLHGAPSLASTCWCVGLKKPSRASNSSNTPNSKPLCHCPQAPSVRVLVNTRQRNWLLSAKSTYLNLRLDSLHAQHGPACVWLCCTHHPHRRATLLTNSCPPLASNGWPRPLLWSFWWQCACTPAIVGKGCRSCGACSSAHDVAAAAASSWLQRWRLGQSYPQFRLDPAR